MFYYGLVHSNQDKYVKCGHARRFGSQSARLGRLRTTPLLQICSSFLPRGRDLELASEAEAITNLNWIKEASCDMARFVDHSGSPRHGEAGRTRSTSARRVGKSGRDGGCGESNHLPSQNMSGPPVTSAPFNAADVKAFYQAGSSSWQLRARPRPESLRSRGFGTSVQVRTSRSESLHFCAFGPTGPLALKPPSNWLWARRRLLAHTSFNTLIVVY